MATQLLSVAKLFPGQSTHNKLKTKESFFLYLKIVKSNYRNIGILNSHSCFHSIKYVNVKKN